MLQVSIFSSVYFVYARVNLDECKYLLKDQREKAKELLHFGLIRSELVQRQQFQCHRVSLPSEQIDVLSFW